MCIFIGACSANSRNHTEQVGLIRPEENRWINSAGINVFKDIKKPEFQNWIGS
jgi:hypothetical protein